MMGPFLSLVICSIILWEPLIILAPFSCTFHCLFLLSKCILELWFITPESNSDYGKFRNQISCSHKCTPVFDCSRQNVTWGFCIQNYLISSKDRLLNKDLCCIILGLYKLPLKPKYTVYSSLYPPSCKNHLLVFIHSILVLTHKYLGNMTGDTIRHNVTPSRPGDPKDFCSWELLPASPDQWKCPYNFCTPLRTHKLSVTHTGKLWALHFGHNSSRYSDSFQVYTNSPGVIMTQTSQPSATDSSNKAPNLIQDPKSHRVARLCKLQFHHQSQGLTLPAQDSASSAITLPFQWKFHSVKLDLICFYQRWTLHSWNFLWKWPPYTHIAALFTPAMLAIAHSRLISVAERIAKHSLWLETPLREKWQHSKLVEVLSESICTLLWLKANLYYPLRVVLCDIVQADMYIVRIPALGLLICWYTQPLFTYTLVCHQPVTSSVISLWEILSLNFLLLSAAEVSLFSSPKIPPSNTPPSLTDLLSIHCSIHLPGAWVVTELSHYDRA